MDDSPPRVRRLPSQLEIATWLQIEMRACCLKLANSGGAFFDEHLDSSRVAQGRARCQRVSSMQLR
jgi:hypothetical protein